MIDYKVYAMSDDKKLSDEKKYAQISRESVRYMAESIGVADLSDEIAGLLAEDTNYRLREIAQNCGQFMRHSKRRKLTVKDFSKVLRWSNIEPIFGYNTIDTLPFQYCKEADVYYCDDREINIVDFGLNSQVFERPGSSFVKAQWLAIEGMQKNLSPGNNGKRTNVVPSVSDDLMSYYEQMTKAILGHDEELMKVALEDLRTNPRIAPLLPYLINFVSIGVKKVSHDLTQLTKLLFTVNSLTCNQALYLEPKPYLSLLSQGLLYCILEPLAASINPTNDHWALRDYAARLLAHIASIWTTPVNRLSDEILISLRDIFSDPMKPFSSHYGAAIGIIAFGPTSVEKYLLPILTKYWPHLVTVVDDSFYPNAQVKADAHKVYGALLLASHIIVEYRKEQFLDGNFEMEIHLTSDEPKDVKSETVGHKRIKTEPIADIDEAITAETPLWQLYKFLYECFGDSLSMRLSYPRVLDFYQKREETICNLFSSPELLQSGEELLEAFIVKEEEWQSMSADDEHSYDDRDDNSLLSDDGETEPRNVDLRIKSTVSDPTLGIKLTIAKLPRSSAESLGRSFKRKKLSIKIKKEKLEESDEPEDTFTWTPGIRNRRVAIEFCFAGAMPIPENKLKRNVIIPTFNQPFVDTATHTISLRMKRKGKLKKLAPHKWWSRKLMTGNVLTIL